MGFKELYDGLFMRKIDNRVFHFIDVTYGEEIGDGFEHKYVIDLKEVDLDSIHPSDLENAKECCGCGMVEEEEVVTDEWLAEMCQSYGLAAPLGYWSGNNFSKLMREARKLSRDTQKDSYLHEDLMSRPVNAIGSTAREFMQGDIQSAMSRMGKPQDTCFSMQANLQETGSDDPLAYVMGFSCAMAGGSLGDDCPRDELAPAYIEGYRKGVAVKMGKEAKPSWVK